MMAEIYGRSTGVCRGKGGSMHIADLTCGMLGANGIVGGGPPLICGAALSHKTLGDGAVAVAFYGDGASNEGTTLESLNLASVWQLPAVFVVEDNGYGEATAASYACAGSQKARAAAFGMPISSVTARTILPCTRRRAKRLPMHAVATARLCCMCTCNAGMAILKAMP